MNPVSSSALVSIIIVNYNAGSFLPKCIQSILFQAYPFVEIIIIDNASQDGSIALIAPDEKIRIIQNQTNAGFARAQNQGMKLARGQYLMPLNFDILLTPDFLAEMVAAIEVSDRIGTVSPKFLRMVDGSRQTDQIDNAGLLLPGNRVPFHRGRDERDHGQYDAMDYVFGAMGAAALYRKEMLEDIAYQSQYFDESYFTWYEDVDLDWRARLRGWDCLYAPRAVAYHAGDPHGHGKSKFGAQTSMRNRWKMILTNECPGCFFRHFSRLAEEEMGLFRHVLLTGLILQYASAMASLVRSLPGILKKRRWVRGRAVRKCLPDYPLPFY